MVVWYLEQYTTTSPVFIWWSKYRIKSVWYSNGIWIPDHSVMGQLLTIWIPDYSTSSTYSDSHSSCKIMWNFAELSQIPHQWIFLDNFLKIDPPIDCITGMCEFFYSFASHTTIQIVAEVCKISHLWICLHTSILFRSAFWCRNPHSNLQNYAEIRICNL